MNKMPLHMIQTDPRNARSGQPRDIEKAAGIAASVIAEQATIEIRRVGKCYEVINGHRRLDIGLEMHDQVLVRVEGGWRALLCSTRAGWFDRTR